MPVTLLYGGALAILFLILSVRVIQGRFGPGNPSLGDGGNPMMQRRIRGHANFAEYVPLILVLMGFLEASGMSRAVIHALGIPLLAGRILHGYTFGFTEKFVFGRTAGVTLTLLVLLASGLLALYVGLHHL
jgi:uncharacterized membrane protein YecN with MAPEG domain